MLIIIISLLTLAVRGIIQAEPRFLVGGIRFDRHFAYKILDLYTKMKGNPVYGTYNFVAPTMHILDLDLVKAVLVKDFQYFSSRGGLCNEIDDPISAHLFVMEGNEKWKKLRTKFTPTFTAAKMKYMFPTLVSVGERFYEVLCKKLETEHELEMKDWLARFTTDIIGTVAFGLECNSLVDPNAKFREIGMKIFSEPRYPTFAQGLIMLYPKIVRLLKLKIIPDAVSEYFTQAVSATVDNRVKNKIQRNDFMDLLINLRNENKSNRMEDAHMDGLSMDEITAQAFVFFFAGFETSSTAMSFTLYELAQNQEIQDKARESVQAVLARQGGRITFDSLKEMTYLNQCLDEGMRKYPPLPMLTRIVQKPYTVPRTNCTLDKGNMVIIPVYSLHHDPEYFPNPEVFNPDNFSEENVKARNPFCYLPFGEGPRNCIGMRFGLMQARMGLAILLSKFKFRLSPKTPVPLVFDKKSFVLTSNTGLYFEIEKL